MLYKGLGLWQTVSVQTVAEEEDRLRVEAVERELELERAAVVHCFDDLAPLFDIYLY